MRAASGPEYEAPCAVRLGGSRTASAECANEHQGAASERRNESAVQHSACGAQPGGRF